MNEQEFKKLFGIRLRALRKVKGITQEKLSELIGLDPQYYCKMENGNHFPSVKTLTKIIETLGVEENELFNFSKKTNSIINSISASLVQFNNKELKIIKEFVDAMIKLQ